MIIMVATIDETGNRYAQLIMDGRSVFNEIILRSKSEHAWCKSSIDSFSSEISDLKG